LYQFSAHLARAVHLRAMTEHRAFQAVGSNGAAPREEATSRRAKDPAMFKWITCYLSGQHEFHVVCEPSAIFLRCHHCGRRSNGWSLQHEQQNLQPAHVPMPRPSQTPLRALR
jgi:hypothetical protein